MNNHVQSFLYYDVCQLLCLIYLDLSIDMCCAHEKNAYNARKYEQWRAAIVYIGYNNKTKIRSDRLLLIVLTR